jgi:hypothetical protein
MAIIKPPVLPAWADTGDKTQPTNAEIDVGWPLSATPPSRQRFNWILNFCANGVRYLTRRGLADWDAAETYSISDRVIGTDGHLYKSLVGANIANSPSSSPAQWEKFGYLKSDFLEIRSDVLLASAVPLVNSVSKNVTSISLPAGTWDIAGMVAFSLGTNTSFSGFSASISQVTNTVDDNNLTQTNHAAFVYTSRPHHGIAINRITIAVTTTFYLVGSATFTVSTAGAYGWISARKVPS